MFKINNRNTGTILLLTFNLIHAMFYCSLKAGKCRLG